MKSAFVAAYVFACEKAVLSYDVVFSIGRRAEDILYGVFHINIS